MTVLSGSISHNSVSDDEFLWLEELQGDKSLQWVQKENQRTIAHFARNQNFLRIEREVLNILNKDSQIPWVSKYGDYYYNFWQDQSNPQGVLRR
ncbi:TPA: S9 family peptidase, partial [Escherichia coli]|nr:S9 family peptidase [Escherichia coli]